MSTVSTVSTESAQTGSRSTGSTSTRSTSTGCMPTYEADFDALVRSPGTGQGEPGSSRAPGEVVFDAIFDLDYNQSVRRPVLVVPRQQTRRVRTAARPRPSSTTAVRLTRRGRLVLVLAFLGLAVALTIPLSGWATATLTGGSAEPVRVIEVAPGETLYGIAGDLAEPGEIREMVHRIQELNSLPGAQISEGQKLAVPRG